MGNKRSILVTAKGLRLGVASVMCATAVLSACGQKGNLYMPNDPEFQQRAKLPDIVRRQFPTGAATPAVTPASAAASNPAATTTPQGSRTTPITPAVGASAPSGR